MKFLAALALALPASAGVAAAPHKETARGAELEERALPRFHLQTKVHAGQGAERFDGLWVASYHTGAGLNDVTVSRGAKGLPMILNGTRLAMIFDEDAGPGAGYFGVELSYAATYASWEPVVANIGYGAKAFKFAGRKLVGGLSHGNSQIWHGWRVCDWWHEVPQLFWTTERNPKVSPGCANVDLIRVDVN